jgi:hypothetical protein
MNEIIIYVLCLFIGWKLREAYAVRQISHFIKLDDEKEQKPAKTLLKLEKQSDIIYAYDNETDEFLGQAQSLDALAQVLGKRFPDKRFTALPKNLKEIGIHNESI